jgi:hypothetical protein
MPSSANQQEAAQSAASDEQAVSARGVAGEVCPTLEQAAAENGLPVEFFVRVIWQESRFNALAVSAKGAQGIAQFMPRTADWRGLSNPFDVTAALKASASYLHDLRTRFGNLGLAAAAYNAGPQRVQDWLLARGGLPKETRRYVQIVTGHSAEEWSGGTTQVNLALPEVVPCGDVVKSMNYRIAAKSDIGREKASGSSTPQATPGWEFNSSVVLPKPQPWRHSNNCRGCISAYWRHGNRSSSNRKSERAASGIACALRLTVEVRPKSCVQVFARRVAIVWCSGIEQIFSGCALR